MSLFGQYTPERRGELPPLEKLSIRLSRPSDAEPIGRLIAEREGRSMTSGLDEAEHEIARSQSAQEFMLCVAEADEKIIAFARCGWLDPRPAGEPHAVPNAAPCGWYLLGIIVDPAFRRRGVGIELTRYRMRWLAKRAREVYYFVNARNRTSIDLHEKLGFIELTREFTIPKVSFSGGAGILFRADLPSPESGPIESHSDPARQPGGKTLEAPS